MRYISQLLAETKNEITPNGGLGIVLTNSFTANMKISNCEIFSFERNFYKEFEKTFAFSNKKFVCKVSLLDKDHETIVFKKFYIPSFVISDPQNEFAGAAVLVSNHFTYNNGSNFYHSPKIISTLTFVLDPRDVAKIKSAKVEFVDD